MLASVHKQQDLVFYFAVFTELMFITTHFFFVPKIKKTTQLTFFFSP